MCASVVRIWHKQVFSWRGSFYCVTNFLDTLYCRVLPIAGILCEWLLAHHVVIDFGFTSWSTLNKEVNRKVQGVPQSQTGVNPRHQEEEKKGQKLTRVEKLPLNSLHFYPTWDECRTRPATSNSLSLLKLSAKATGSQHVSPSPSGRALQEKNKIQFASN